MSVVGTGTRKSGIASHNIRTNAALILVAATRTVAAMTTHFNELKRSSGALRMVLCSARVILAVAINNVAATTGTMTAPANRRGAGPLVHLCAATMDSQADRRTMDSQEVCQTMGSQEA